MFGAYRVYFSDPFKTDVRFVFYKAYDKYEYPLLESIISAIELSSITNSSSLLEQDWTEKMIKNAIINFDIFFILILFANKVPKI